MPETQYGSRNGGQGDLALIVVNDYLIHAAGALAALDSESKISP